MQSHTLAVYSSMSVNKVPMLLRFKEWMDWEDCSGGKALTIQA